MEVIIISVLPNVFTWGVSTILRTFVWQSVELLLSRRTLDDSLNIGYAIPRNNGGSASHLFRSLSSLDLFY